MLMLLMMSVPSSLPPQAPPMVISLPPQAPPMVKTCKHCAEPLEVGDDAHWVPVAAREGDEWGLMSRDVHVGSYSYSQGRYLPIMSDGTWGKECDPPISLPRQEGGSVFPGSASVIPNQHHYFVWPDFSFLTPSRST